MIQPLLWRKYTWEEVIFCYLETNKKDQQY